MLGDNRDASLDSRYWGFVPRHAFKGKALFIYFSNDSETSRLPVPSTIRWQRIGDRIR